MKLHIGPDASLSIVITDGDRRALVEAATGTKFTARQVLEAYIDRLNANIDQDLDDLIDDMLGENPGEQ